MVWLQLLIDNRLQDVILRVHDDGKVFLRPCRPAFAERSPSLFQAQLSAATITAAADRRRQGGDGGGKALKRSANRTLLARARRRHAMRAAAAIVA